MDQFGCVFFVILTKNKSMLIMPDFTLFKCLHGMAPPYLCDCITMNDEVVIRDTRASTSTNILMTPHAPLDIFKNSLSYRGPLTWNALPESIRKCATLNSFKKALRAHVFI